MSFLEAIVSMAGYWGRILGSWFSNDHLEEQINHLNPELHNRECRPGC